MRDITLLVQCFSWMVLCGFAGASPVANLKKTQSDLGREMSVSESLDLGKKNVQSQEFQNPRVEQKHMADSEVAAPEIKFSERMPEYESKITNASIPKLSSSETPLNISKLDSEVGTGATVKDPVMKNNDRINLQNSHELLHTDEIISNHKKPLISNSKEKQIENQEEKTNSEEGKTATSENKQANDKEKPNNFQPETKGKDSAIKHETHSADKKDFGNYEYNLEKSIHRDDPASKHKLKDKIYSNRRENELITLHLDLDDSDQKDNRRKKPVFRVTNLDYSYSDWSHIEGKGVPPMNSDSSSNNREHSNSDDNVSKSSEGKRERYVDREETSDTLITKKQPHSEERSPLEDQDYDSNYPDPPRLITGVSGMESDSGYDYGTHKTRSEESDEKSPRPHHKTTIPKDNEDSSSRSESDTSEKDKKSACAKLEHSSSDSSGYGSEKADGKSSGSGSTDEYSKEDSESNSSDSESDSSDSESNRPDPKRNRPDTKCNRPDSESDSSDSESNRPGPKRNRPDPKSNSSDSESDSSDSESNRPGPKRNRPDPKSKSSDSENDSSDSESNSPDHKRNRPNHKRNRPDPKSNRPDSESNRPDPESNSSDSESDSSDSESNSPDHKRNRPDHKKNRPDPKSNRPDSESNSSDSKNEKVSSSERKEKGNNNSKGDVSPIDYDLLYSVEP